MKKSQLALAILIILAVTAIVIYALFTVKQNNSQDRFSVVGSGTVYAKADIANIEVGLKTDTKKTAAEATTESNDKMNKIVNELKKLNIEDKDIKTSNYSLNPVYNWTNVKGQELVGYEVTQTLTLKIRDLNRIGDVIAKTTEQGANQIGNINFTIDDEFALKNQARELAIAKAQEKAMLIAKQSGMKLGEVKSVYENAEPVVSPIMYSNAKMDASVGGAISVSTPDIQSGQNEIKVDVTLVYEVK
ncbi:MAG: SIMPL domain-containing protein [Candidatus Falkowbacteria bacterium]